MPPGETARLFFSPLSFRWLVSTTFTLYFMLCSIIQYSINLIRKKLSYEIVKCLFSGACVYCITFQRKSQTFVCYFFKNFWSFPQRAGRSAANGGQCRSFNLKQWTPKSLNNAAAGWKGRFASGLARTPFPCGVQDYFICLVKGVSLFAAGEARRARQRQAHA